MLALKTYAWNAWFLRLPRGSGNDHARSRISMHEKWSTYVSEKNFMRRKNMKYVFNRRRHTQNLRLFFVVGFWFILIFWERHLIYLGSRYIFVCHSILNTLKWDYVKIILPPKWHNPRDLPLTHVRLTKNHVCVESREIASTEFRMIFCLACFSCANLFVNVPFHQSCHEDLFGTLRDTLRWLEP